MSNQESPAFRHGECQTAEKKIELSLTTGWLDSDTGLRYGHVSGWTDTDLGVLYKNNHPKNDVHYGLDLNLPTGQDNVHQNAMLAENLAPFTSFSEGWQAMPSVEMIHHITERDSLAGKLSFSFRGDYNYRTSLTAAGRQQLSAHLTDVQLQERIDPDSQLQQELSYQHIGEHQQFQAQLVHVNASHADYQSKIQTLTWDAVGNSTPLSGDYGSGRNNDGEDWTLRLYHTVRISMTGMPGWSMALAIIRRQIWAGCIAIIRGSAGRISSRTASPVMCC